VARRREIRSLPHRGNDVAFAADGRTLAFGGLVTEVRQEDDATIISGIVRSGLADADTGQAIGRPLKVQGSTVGFAPDGKMLATGVGSCVHFVGVIGGDGLEDRKRDYRLGLWETATGQEVLRLPQRNAAVLAFSPDGALLATGSWDGPVQLWELIN